MCHLDLEGGGLCESYMKSIPNFNLICTNKETYASSLSFLWQLCCVSLQKSDVPSGPGRGGGLCESYLKYIPNFNLICPNKKTYAKTFLFFFFDNITMNHSTLGLAEYSLWKTHFSLQIRYKWGILRDGTGGRGLPIRRPGSIRPDNFQEKGPDTSLPGCDPVAKGSRTLTYRDLKWVKRSILVLQTPSPRTLDTHTYSKDSISLFLKPLPVTLHRSTSLSLYCRFFTRGRWAKGISKKEYVSIVHTRKNGILAGASYLLQFANEISGDEKCKLVGGMFLPVDPGTCSRWINRGESLITN